jgi:HEAT repeat protein
MSALRKQGLAVLVALAAWPGNLPAQGDGPVVNGDSLSTWVRWLRSKSSDERLEAAQALGAFGPEGRAAVRPLCDALKDENGRVRQAAAEALGAMGPEARAAVGPLLAAMKADENEGPVRVACIVALGRIGDPAARPALIAALNDDEKTAADALADLGPDRAAIEALIGKLGLAGGGRSYLTAEAAKQALSRMGKLAVAPLRAALKNKPEAAARALAGLGKVGVGPLTEALKDKNERTRCAAARALGTMGAEAGPAVPALAALLKEEKDEHVRCTVCEALQELGPHSRAAVPALAQALADRDHDVRQQAADALGACGPGARAAVPALIARLKEGDEEARDHVIGALGAIGPGARPAVAPLRRLLKSGKPALAFRAAEALARISPEEAETILPPLLKALKAPAGGPFPPDGRARAARALAFLGARAAPASALLAERVATADNDDLYVYGEALNAIGEPAVGPVLEALKKSDNEGARELLGWALEGIGKPALSRWLKDSHPRARQVAVSRLAAFAPPVPEAVPFFQKALEDASPDNRRRVAWSLGQYGKAGVPALVKALKGPDAELRAEAASALAAIGPEAREAVAPLLAALDDRDSDLRREAAAALGRIGPQARAAVGPLTRLLKDSEGEVRGAAALALGEIGPDSKPALGALRGLLKDPDGRARRGAACALVRLSPEAPPDCAAVLLAGFGHRDVNVNTTHQLIRLGPLGVPLLLAAVKGNDLADRRRALAHLRLLGPQAKAAVGPLGEALGQLHPEVRQDAARALGALGPEARAAAPALARALTDHERAVRVRAAEALGQIGPAAKMAIPGLVLALEDRERAVRQAAALALKKVSPEAARRAGVP